MYRRSNGFVQKIYFGWTMRVILQRVHDAKLTSGDFSSQIGLGVLAFVGVNANDTIFDIKYLARKIVNMRLFRDADDKTNLSVLDVKGQIMLVSNFSLQADTRRGLRPDFINAAKGDFALDYYQKLIAEVEKYGVKVATGRFGHHMDIQTNLFGPFTLILESEGRTNEWDFGKIILFV